jgi:hypothetical protein
MRDRKPRSYSYRIPLDEKITLLRLRRYQRSHDEYNISKLSRRDVPNWGAAKNVGVVFYKSTESWNYEKEEYEGGAIPGLGEYRYSLDWQPTPETELVEMKGASGGGTKLRGEQHHGTADPRIPRYIPFETTIPWTLKEVQMMFDNEPVPNRLEYSNDPPLMDAQDARSAYRKCIKVAVRDAVSEIKSQIKSAEENCDHEHVLRAEEQYQDSYCEDCQRSWPDNRELDALVEAGDATIVGSV